MAVDSAAKRFSMMSFGGDEFALVVPEDGDHEQDEERLNEVFLYYGVGVEEPPEVSPRSDRSRRGTYIRHGKKRG